MSATPPGPPGSARPQAENARLVAGNCLATQVKFMPLASLPRILAVEAGSLLRAAGERRFRATLLGKLSALRWLPSLWAVRRRLAGDAGRVSRWLGVRL